MTVATFYYSNGCISGFSVEGHSGFAEAGEDILCAAISSAVRLVECTISDVIGLYSSITVRDGYVALELPKELDEKLAYCTEQVLTGMLLHFQSLAEECPQCLQVVQKS